MRVDAVSEMIGVTMASADAPGDALIFTAEDGRRFVFEHMQDCCECVRIEDICGDLPDLVGSPIVLAEEVTNADEPPAPEHAGSYTWTFYRFATAKGTVTVRWLGESNGYYGEGVDFYIVPSEASPTGSEADG